MNIRVFTYIILLLACACGPLKAQPFYSIDRSSVIVCETAERPDFNSSDCERIDVWDVDPQGTHFWMQADIDIPLSLLSSDEPLGFYFAGKASAVFYMNGARVGASGKPGHSLREEEAGPMDTVFYLPRSILREGKNTLVIEMSGYHGYIKLVQPIHRIGVAEYVQPTDIILRSYSGSIIPFGVLVIGVFYFGLLALRSETPKTQIWVPLMAFFALGQLSSEISRGLFPYSWPFHDIRLMAILFFGIAASASLLMHVVQRFLVKWQTRSMLVYLLGLCIPAFVVPGFDAKSVAVFLTAAIIGAVVSFSAYRRGDQAGLKYGVAFLIFTISVHLVPSGFLDRYYYYFVAALLIFLFAQQIKQLEAERAQQVEDQARADRLQQMLDEANERVNPRRIKVSHEGKVELVSAGDIAYCKGARDYVELKCNNGKTILCSHTLADLENELSGSFLKVHRSYLVNGDYAETLEREANGAGKLLLKNGEYIPVSRRIMPKVRKALA